MTEQISGNENRIEKNKERKKLVCESSLIELSLPRACFIGNDHLTLPLFDRAFPTLTLNIYPPDSSTLHCGRQSQRKIGRGI